MIRRFVITCLVVGIAICVARAQFPPQDPNKPIIRNFEIPPAPILSPADELKTIKLPDGYRLELVASEPLIHDPVSMTFDPDGRIWVCEMPAYMIDVDGTGQNNPACTVAVLQDTNGDGVMDSRTVFLDKLVLPRSVCWTSDGILIAENGNIWLCYDRNGDLKCDDKEIIAKYTVGNVEHSLNGLVPMLDNWIYNAKEGLRFRKIDGRWVTQSTIARGQWGITQDNHGYLYYNTNSDLIRSDLVPSYSPSAHFTNPLLNQGLHKDQILWPIRPNTGINRGYLDEFLRPDGTMILFNSNCGPVIYRGNNLPKELIGNYFTNEPAGNLVRRQIISIENGVKTSNNAYDKREFMASTDERFRPVNMFNTPDGTLYMIDMYRGLIQDGAFLTPYLKGETLARNLDKGHGMGRIWRIAHQTTQARKPVALSKASSAELVGHLSHTNGWHRDMAQQLLVQRNDPAVVAELKQLAASGSSALGRLHALWTLEGMKKIDDQTLSTALSDKDVNLQASAAALSHAALARDATSPLVEKIALLAGDADMNVRLQVVFALGLVNTSAAAEAIDPILKQAAANPQMLEGLLAGFSGREVEFLAGRVKLRIWANAEPWRQQLLTATAGLIWRQRQPLAILRLMHLIDEFGEDRAWQQVALLEGLAAPQAAGRRGRGAAPRAINLPMAPDGISDLRSSPNPQIKAAADRLATQLNWPGKDGQPLPVPAPLSPKHQALYELGRQQYLNTCAACHHPAGLGDAGKGPTLLDSDWLDNDQRLVRLILHGLRGPITVNGESFNQTGSLEMPGWAKTLTNEQIAGIVTFIRREWRENGKPIDSETVSQIRGVTSERTNQWVEKELIEIR